MKIQEIISIATENQRVAIITGVAVKGRVSIHTVDAWLKGSRTPKYLYKELIASAIKEHCGIEATPEELFGS